MALPQFVVSGGPAYARLSQPVSDTICFSSELSWSFCSAVSPERRLPWAYAPYPLSFFKNAAVSRNSIGPPFDSLASDSSSDYAPWRPSSSRFPLLDQDSPNSRHPSPSVQDPRPRL